jgi:hypothetical protein
MNRDLGELCEFGGSTDAAKEARGPLARVFDLIW